MIPNPFFLMHFGGFLHFLFFFFIIASIFRFLLHIFNLFSIFCPVTGSYTKSVEALKNCSWKGPQQDHLVQNQYVKALVTLNIREAPTVNYPSDDQNQMQILPTFGCYSTENTIREFPFATSCDSTGKRQNYQSIP